MNDGINQDVGINYPAGLVVLYNPILEVVNNVASYLPYISHLYVIDNSEKPELEIIDSLLKKGNKISYISLGGNMGIAKALNKASELAYDSGFKWILTMDQDSHFCSGSIFKLLSEYKFENVAIVAASFDLNFYYKKESIFPDFYEVGYVITSGNFLNLSVWKKIGGFLDDLFIDEVDNEFCIRANNYGFKILTSKEVFLVHKLGRKVGVNKLLGFGKSNLSIHSEIRLYYMFRNNTYLMKKYFFSNFRFIVHRMWKLLIMFFKVLVIFPKKRSCLINILRGLEDGIKNKMGKYSYQP